MIQDSSTLLKHKRSVKDQIINRHNVKFFIRILVGLALAHFIGHQFRLSDAAPNRKFSLKNRPQKISIANESINDQTTSTIRTTTVATESTTISWQPGQLKNCTEPAIDEFPDDLFTQSQRSHGAVIFHLFACFYNFIAIAIVVDDYFIEALDKLCAALNLDEDVAGATFMAGGSSSPELFIALIGIFVAKGDVGVGTIVGSAVFNVVCVIGICGLFVNGAIRLTWWPLCRDSVYYAFSIIILILCLSDGRITLFESGFLLFIYVGYIIIMCNNQNLQRFIARRWQIFQLFNAAEEPIMNYAQTQINYGMNSNYQRFEEEMNSTRMSMNDPVSMDFETTTLRIMMTRRFSPQTRFKMAVRFVISQAKSRKGRGISRPEKPSSERRFSFYQGRTPSLLAINETYDHWKIIPNYNYNPIGFIKWASIVPVRIMFYYTIPDCRRPRFFKWYPLTFAMTIVWLTILTYFMVWMVTIIGFTFGIPDSIMGITFLAAGSSVPDALSSILVVRQGLVDMGVSNTFGSNVFDLLVGLALPWFAKILISGEPVYINSNGLLYDAVLLLGIVIITVMSIHGRRWYLDRFLGMFFLAVYAIFVVFSLLIELNVFGFVNPPMCV
ncbi:unnamed protein product [Rotaria magnacalcarata]|uniref:Sodium/calcium exchanger membrane region domain-containing protein n=6 Tax=Rotaria magnacalcarata TaxID=392030 RepID=A0A815MNH8_9BILA|nr:unnamed protein product [Rotaria magnacalcarata]CAF1572476.1 unnamed protein product [Rotaria magnacalcarata]CAF2124566.1 unnamed protein product [Rotaria magnacalcarata]CAF3958133.1 unnamed protein product [Rotaria magnacalcarata]